MSVDHDAVLLLGLELDKIDLTRIDGITQEIIDNTSIHDTLRIYTKGTLVSYVIYENTVVGYLIRDAYEYSPEIIRPLRMAEELYERVYDFKIFFGKEPKLYLFVDIS